LTRFRPLAGRGLQLVRQCELLVALTTRVAAVREAEAARQREAARRRAVGDAEGAARALRPAIDHPRPFVVRAEGRVCVCVGGYPVMLKLFPSQKSPG
jgi:hypothetical protein